MESKVYLVKLLQSGETLLFRGQYSPETQLLSADAIVYTMQVMMTPEGHPTIVPTPNWILGMEVNDLILHVPTHVLYFSDKVPADLTSFYLQKATGLVPATVMPGKTAGGLFTP